MKTVNLADGVDIETVLEDQAIVNYSIQSNKEIHEWAIKLFERQSEKIPYGTLCLEVIEILVGKGYCVILVDPDNFVDNLYFMK